MNRKADVLCEPSAKREFLRTWQPWDFRRNDTHPKDWAELLGVVRLSEQISCLDLAYTRLTSSLYAASWIERRETGTCSYWRVAVTVVLEDSTNGRMLSCIRLMLRIASSNPRISNICASSVLRVSRWVRIVTWRDRILADDPV